MRRLTIGPIVCVIAALMALGLWPSSYKSVRAVNVALGKYSFVSTSYNGNLNFSHLTRLKNATDKTFDISYSTRAVTLSEPGTESAEQHIRNNMPSKVRRPFGKPHFKTFAPHTLNRWTFQLPHWIVALVFLGIGTFSLVFGKRPDDAVELD